MSGIQRQGVQSGTGPVVQEARFSRQTVATQGQPQADLQEPRSARVARALFDFGGNVMDKRVQSLRSQVELDKITQTQRAIEGLDPTDDASVAGVRANRTVRMRDDVLQANNQIAEWTRTNPDASDEAYQDFSRQVFSQVLQQYEDDPTMARAASSRIQEAAVQVHQIRSAAKRQHQEFEAQDNFANAVQLYRDASSSPDELLQAIETDAYQEGRAMGVLEQDQRNILMNQARRDAQAGDSRLLDALEETDWGKADLRAQQARNEFNRWEAARAAVDLGDTWADLQTAWVSRESTWEQTAEAIRQLNERHPNSISMEQVASLKQRGLREHSRGNDLTGLLQDVMSGGVPLSQRDNVPDADKREVVGMMSNLYDQMSEQMIAEGAFDGLDVPPEVAAHHWRLQHKIAFGNQNLVPVPEVATAIDRLRNFTPSEDMQELPAWASTALFSMSQIGPAQADLYGGDQVTAFYQNYQRWAEEEGDVNAFNRAWRSTFGGHSAGPVDRTVLRESVNRQVRKESTDWVRKLPFNGMHSAPSWETDRITTEVMQYAEDLLQSGAVNPELVVQASIERFTSTHTQLNSGTFVKGDIHSLSTAMGFLNEDGSPFNNSAEMVQGAFEWLFEQNASEWQLESRTQDLGIRDVMFDINPRTAMLTPRDTFGQAIGLPIHLSEFGLRYYEETAPNRTEQARRAVRRREAELEYQQQAPARLGRDAYFFMQP